MTGSGINLVMTLSAMERKDSEAFAKYPKVVGAGF